jgi:hypothetical protein
VALLRSQATQSLGVYLGYPVSRSHKYKDLVIQVWGLARAWQHLPIKHVSKSEEQDANPYRNSQQDATVYQFHVFHVSMLYEAQHVFSDTPPIIRSSKLH